MSYARWGHASDVYSYPADLGDGRLAVVCCGCGLPGAVARTPEDAAGHALAHVERGDRVPVELIDPGLYRADLVTAGGR